MIIGLDIGSVSVNAVLIDADNTIHEDLYIRTKGQPVEKALDAIKTHH